MLCTAIQRKKEKSGEEDWVEEEPGLEVVRCICACAAVLVRISVNNGFAARPVGI